MKSAVKGVQQFEKELNVTHEVQDITLLMSYVALKASEVVLDGHREVLLAVLPLHFYRESAELSCWRLSLRRIPAVDPVSGAAGGTSCTSPILEQL